MPTNALAISQTARGYWKPTRCNGCVLWLSSTSVSQTSGNTDTLVDLSTSAINFGGASDTTRPAYAAGPPTTVTFDGTNDVRTNDTTVPGCTDAMTVGIVFKCTTRPTGTQFQYVFKIRTNTSAMCDFFFSGSGNAGTFPTVYSCKVPGAGQAGVGFSAANDTNYHALLFSFAGGTATTSSNYHHSIDKAAVTTPTGETSGAVAFGSSNVTGAVGAYVNSGTASTWAKVIIKDLFFINRSLWDTDKDEFELANWWLNDTRRTLQ